MTEAERITRALNGRWYGYYGVAYCPAHDNKRTPALSIANSKTGRLMAYCHAGCTFLSILNAMNGLFSVGANPSLPSSGKLNFTYNHALHLAAAMKREGQALRIWDEAQPILSTIAETYLRSRGITCELPKTLRFHPECWHGPSAKPLPAMVAMVEGGERAAVHRTYLQPDGSGKSFIKPDKMMLGATCGAAVRLSDGPAKLVLAEGIETALSLSCGLLRRPATVWAALSCSGMRNLRLPEQPGRLTIAADGDEPGSAAAKTLAKRAKGLGWQVSLMPAPNGRDWNDVLIDNGLR